MIKKNGGVIINPFCSLSCLFCGNKRMKATDIEDQELKIYKNLIDFKKEGIKKIEISGSDPLEYEKITELIKYMKKIGFDVQISTNGVRLFESSFLNKLISSKVDSLRIPIYGSNSKIHDSITQTSGSFNKTVIGIKNLLKKRTGIKIQISSLVMKQNKNDLFEIVDLVNELGISDFYFSIPCIINNDEKFYIPLKDLTSCLRKLYRYALKINKETIFFEIPFCVFDDFNLKNINNKCHPPNLGKYNQPPDVFKTSTPDLPSYRVKKKIKMCYECKAFNYCDGFFVNDIDKFGVGKINKINKCS